MGAESPATAVEQERVIASLPEELRELGRHVLLGKFNRQGDPVGFHHAPGGRCPPGRRIDKVLERYPDGSYRAAHERLGCYVEEPDEPSSDRRVPPSWARADHVLPGVQIPGQMT